MVKLTAYYLEVKQYWSTLSQILCRTFAILLDREDEDVVIAKYTCIHPVSHLNNGSSLPLEVEQSNWPYVIDDA